MAVGVCFAGFLAGNAGIALLEAIVLAVGIAIQNIPERCYYFNATQNEWRNQRKSFF